MQNYSFNELKELIEINSYTKNKDGVDKVGEIFSTYMHQLGYEVIKYKREQIGNHLHFKSLHVKGKKLLLLGHLDTVFPPNTFEGFREDDEYIYGAGVCDMKGGNHVALESLRALHVKHGSIKNIDMLLVADEETGSDDSREVTLNLAKDYDYALVFEAAGKDDEVVVGRKGVATYFVDIKGKAVHAGNHYNEGVNANLEAAYKLIQFTKLTDLEKGTTVNVGKIEGGIGANTISPNAKLTLEARYENLDERDRVVKQIEKITKTSYVMGSICSLGGGIQRDVMEPNDKTYNFANIISDIIGYNLKTEKRGGVSDANLMASGGVITLDGFGPFGDGDHTKDERALKSSYIKRIKDVSKILIHFSQNGYKF